MNAKQTISKLSTKVAILATAVAAFMSASSALAGPACETVESSRSYLSGLCPSDHQDVDGKHKIQLSYECEMMANNDFIVNEKSKTTTCDEDSPAAALTTAQARIVSPGTTN